MRKIPGVTGILLLSIPVYLLALWFYACSRADYPANQKLYAGYLPQFLKGHYAPALFPLPFCVGAILLNIKNMKSTSRSTKLLSSVIVITGGLLIFINLWSMM
jgi:hypothetical protein